MAKYDLIITVSAGLHYRTGSGTNFPSKGTYPKGTNLICDEKKHTPNGERWYRIIKNGYWICGFQPGGGWYVEDRYDIENPPGKPNPSKPIPDKPTNNPDAPPYNQSNIDQIKQENSSVTGQDIKSKPRYSAIALNPILVNENFPKMISSTNGKATYDFTTDTSWLTEYINIMKYNLNIDTGLDGKLTTRLFSEFNRHKVDFPDTRLSKTFAYVIFTRPDLNIVEGTDIQKFNLHKQVVNHPTIYYAYKTKREIVSSLTSMHSGDHDFNVLLSNAAESFEISDEFIKASDTGETLRGNVIKQAGTNIESRAGGNFSVKYTDDNELNIYKMHKIWVDYMSAVKTGELTPKRQYKLDRSLDYACSAYFFLCGEDGETILFWSKYYGVFPTNLPSSTFSWSKGSNIASPEYNISYEYSFKRDFDPISLAEFNINSDGGDYRYYTIYDPKIQGPGNTFAGAPFVDTVATKGTYLYKLRFRVKK